MWQKTRTKQQDGRYLLVGNYTPPDKNGNGEYYEKAWYGQGCIYKNDRAFYEGAPYGAKQGVCYIPELTDTRYSYIDFFRICNKQTDIAEELYEAVDWQDPTSLLHQWMEDGEIIRCQNCGKLFHGNDERICTYCREKYETED